MLQVSNRWLSIAVFFLVFSIFHSRTCTHTRTCAQTGALCSVSGVVDRGAHQPQRDTRAREIPWGESEKGKEIALLSSLLLSHRSYFLLSLLLLLLFFFVPNRTWGIELYSWLGHIAPG